MENKRHRGRPTKSEKIVRRDHFSVWVTKEEKQKISEIIEKSGLSASQFFVTLALDSPWKRPKRRELPTKTAETIRILEQLAGILSLAVLKTKDHQMQSQHWEHSSQRVRLIADLISLWLFEEFEIRTVQKTLSETIDLMKQLNIYIGQMLESSEGKNQILGSVAQLIINCKALLTSHEAYYQNGEFQRSTRDWVSRQAENPTVAHKAVEEALSKIIKRIEHDW